jgi:hypothetical protein
LALDRVQQHYPQSQVVVLAYHSSYGYNIPYSTTRLSYYGVSGLPTVWFNGLSNIVGGAAQSQGESGIQMIYDTYTSKIQSEQTRMANNNPFDLVLRGQISPASSAMTLYVNTTTGYPHTVNAIFLIAEDAIPVSADNGQTVLNAVVRGYLGTKSIILTSSGSTTVNASIDSFSYNNITNLRPAVILQDATTKDIIGAVTEFTLPITSVFFKWQLYN